MKKKSNNRRRRLRSNETFFTHINKSSEDSVKASFVISDMIARSSIPFVEGQFVKDCMVKACKIICHEKRNSLKA